MPLFQIVHMTFINCNNIEVFRDNPFEMQNSQAQNLDAQKLHSSLDICHLLSANFLLLIIFSLIFLLFIPSKHHFFFKSKVDFHGLSKGIPNNIERQNFHKILQIFWLQIFAQIRARRKVLMGLNEDYDLHRCRRMLNQSNSQKKSFR